MKSAGPKQAVADLQARLAALESQGLETSLDDLARELDAATAAAKDWAGANPWRPVFFEPELALAARNRAFADALDAIEEKLK